MTEYSDSYSKTSGSLWQYYKDEPNDNLADSESFKSKVKITWKSPAGGNTKLLQQLKSGFRRTINWKKYQSDPKTMHKTDI